MTTLNSALYSTTPSLTDTLMTLRDARMHLKRRGVTISRATIYRWASALGSGGVRLETWAIGGRRYTSVEALQRFVQASTEMECSQSVSQPSRC